MGTIGCGAMYPTGRAANLLMIAESVTGLLVIAVATGLVFARFSRSTACVRFSHQVVLSPVDGAPTPSIRVGNERGSSEGKVSDRTYDLPPRRDRRGRLARVADPAHRRRRLAAARPLARAVRQGRGRAPAQATRT
jgi:hypothetical protein